MLPLGMDQAPENEKADTIALAQRLLAHGRGHRLMGEVTDMGLVAACACAMNKAFGLEHFDTDRFAITGRIFQPPGAQPWERTRVFTLSVDGEVLGANGAVGWQAIADGYHGCVAMEWGSEPFGRVAGLEMCRDLGHQRAMAMLEMARELEALAVSWQMEQATKRAPESGPKPRRV